MSSIEDQVVALAGVFQSAVLIEQLSISGEMNQAAFDCSFDSLFSFDAQSTLEVFGDLAGITRGLQALTEYLGGKNKQPGKNIAYYVISMIKIATELKKNHAMANHIQQSLTKIQSQASDFDFARRTVVTKIDALYQDSISTLLPRIMVRGDQNHLRNSENVSRIRTLLFAGIRASVLWQQLGGSKLKLIIVRKKYVESAQQLLLKI